MDGLLRVLDLDHAWLPFGSGGLNKEGRTRRLPLQPCFSVYFYFIKLRDIFGQLFLGVLAFGLLGLAGFSTTRGLTGFWVAAAKMSSLAQNSTRCDRVHASAIRFIARKRPGSNSI
jgi:hypothetical protein